MFVIAALLFAAALFLICYGVVDCVERAVRRRRRLTRRKVRAARSDSDGAEPPFRVKVE